MYTTLSDNKPVGFDATIEYLWRRVNWNTGSEDCQRENTCYTQDEVKRVLQTYNALAKKGTVPIYNGANGSQVVVAVSNATGIERGKVGAILKELKDATDSNQLDSREYLAPPGAKTTVGTTNTSGDPNVKDSSGVGGAPWYKNPWIWGGIVSVVGSGVILHTANKRGLVGG